MCCICTVVVIFRFHYAGLHGVRRSVSDTEVTASDFGSKFSQQFPS